MKIKEFVPLIQCAYIVNGIDQDGEPCTLHSSWDGEIPDDVALMDIESVDQNGSEIIINV